MPSKHSSKGTGKARAPEPDLFSELDPGLVEAGPVTQSAASGPPEVGARKKSELPKSRRPSTSLTLAQVLAKLPPGVALAEVAVEGVVRGTFTYLVDERWPEPRRPGVRVQVPFGPRAVP